MGIQDQLRLDLWDAMRAKDVLRKRAIRMALAGIKNAEVDKNAELTEDEVIGVIHKRARQLREAITDFERGKRDDLVQEASAEIAFLQSYLPQALERDEIVELAQQAIEETGATSPKQMGQVMRVLMPRVRGKADGRVVSEVVRSLLSR